MCEGCLKTRSGWRGFMELPPPRPLLATGEWVDLSHPVSPTMPCASIFPAPRFERVRQVPQDPFNVTEMHMVAHAGTHVDSPIHFFNDAPGFEDIPPERLCGPGVVWHLPQPPDGVIGIGALQRARPLLQPGDILAIDTGWAARVGTALYERHPSLSVEAARWLVDQRVKLFACDFATPDLVYHLRAPGFDWPVHRTLLGNGVLVCEHLTGHAGLAGRRVEFVFGALNVTGCDGAPARVLARPIAD
ncbi:cyclase family protein [Xanthobacter sp. V3C-3]|uniref:cyclase family protein n=1 Tax=Xanthobacter lutulentifluminis TaxID=3119935 RepID=UPI00372BAA3E